MAAQDASRAPKRGGQAPVPDGNQDKSVRVGTAAPTAHPGSTGHPLPPGIARVAGAGLGQHAARGGGPTSKQSVSTGK